MLEPFTLEGPRVRLEPLSEAHIPGPGRGGGARTAANYQWTYTPDGVEQMTDYVRDALAKVASGAHVAFATVSHGHGRQAAATRWSAPRGSAKSPSGSGRPGRATSDTGVPDVVDIGFTWLAGSAQRTRSTPKRSC